jgi:NAD(P)-dependent dehydrogenase (short-subunit alcohol dehydrogenase family)
MVFGVGPGLGMSVAHRFGAEDHSVAVVSRNADRHAAYVKSLSDAGVEARSFVGDASDIAGVRQAVNAVRTSFGRIDVGYFGPASTDSWQPTDITSLGGASAIEAMHGVGPAVEFGAALIPEFVQRGSGGILFAGGASSVTPMPHLGGLALASAALRNYALTLHAALAPFGVYAGTLTIGGLIERGDIHGAVGTGLDVPTLDPDDLAEQLWQLYVDRTAAERVVS